MCGDCNSTIHLSKKAALTNWEFRTIVTAFMASQLNIVCMFSDVLSITDLYPKLYKYFGPQRLNCNDTTTHVKFKEKLLSQFNGWCFKSLCSMSYRLSWWFWGLIMWGFSFSLSSLRTLPWTESTIVGWLISDFYSMAAQNPPKGIVTD